MSTPYVGEIRIFGFQRVPTGWFACDGSLKSIAEYQVLYTLLGTSYGGDGVQTFAVPDLRGRAPIQQGQGPGLSTYVLGQRAGTEQVTLTTNQMPGHYHAFIASTATATASVPGATLTTGALPSDGLYVANLSGLATVELAAQTVTATGGNQPHDNMMPTLTASYCIAWAGVFPSQN